METLHPSIALHEYPLEVYADAHANYEDIPSDKFDILSCGEHVLIKSKGYVYRLFSREDLRALYRSYLISNNPDYLKTMPAAFWESQLARFGVGPIDLVLELRPMVCEAWEHFAGELLAGDDDPPDILPPYLFDQVASQCLGQSNPTYDELLNYRTLLPHIIRFIRGLYPDYRALAGACATYRMQQCRDEDDTDETLIYEPLHHPVHFYRFRVSPFCWDEQQFRLALADTLSKSDRHAS